MIWRYTIPTGDMHDPDYKHAYGVPVLVMICGTEVEVVYQFGAGGQECAAVHWQTGRIVARIRDGHTGYPAERAQKAINERMQGVKPRVYRRSIEVSAVLNKVPTVVG